jgi:hypothetical protein
VGTQLVPYYSDLWLLARCSRLKIYDLTMSLCEADAIGSQSPIYGFCFFALACGVTSLEQNVATMYLLCNNHRTVALPPQEVTYMSVWLAKLDPTVIPMVLSIYTAVLCASADALMY